MIGTKFLGNSMDSRDIKKRLFKFIKIISIVLITSAIGLELWNVYALLTNSKIPSILHPIFLIERLAIASHFVEAMIAAYKAPSKNKMPLKYGTYTFFVGTVGLLELFDE
jgi:membrane-associated HD superfamily phosphohydrolase